MKKIEKTIEQKFLFDSPPGAVVTMNGKEFTYFGGTGYYELNNNKKVKRASIDALKKYGITSSSSRSSFGTTKLLLDLEKEAAKFFNCEEAVYLSSGFLTDLAAINVLMRMDLFDTIFIDEISHYSNFFASRISQKPIFQFSHLNAEDLEVQVSKNFSNGNRPLIITDGVFPIYGKIAPVDKYLEIANKYNGILWIDDAHGIGIIGKNGRGTAEHYSLKSDSIYFGGTFSKAFGGFGGIIPGKTDFVKKIKSDQLQNGSTPPPSSAIAASLAGMKILKSNSKLRTKLHQNAQKLKSGLKKIGLDVDDSNIPIAAWELKNPADMKKVRDELVKKKILIQYINYMGAGKYGALRVVVFTTHTHGQIENLLYELNKLL